MRKVFFHLVLFSSISLANADTINTSSGCNSLKVTTIVKGKCNNCVAEGKEFNDNEYKRYKNDPSKYCQSGGKDVQVNPGTVIKPIEKPKEEKIPEPIVPHVDLAIIEIKDLSSKVEPIDENLQIKSELQIFQSNISTIYKKVDKRYRKLYEDFKSQRDGLYELSTLVFDWEEVQTISGKNNKADIKFKNPYHKDNKLEDFENSSLAFYWLIGTPIKDRILNGVQVKTVYKADDKKDCQSMCGLWLKEDSSFGDIKCIAPLRTNLVHKDCGNYTSKEKEVSPKIVVPGAWHKEVKPTVALKNLLSKKSFESVIENDILKSKLEELDSKVQELE